MSLINSIFLSLLAAAAVLNFGNKRGLMWLALLAFNYALSCLYWRGHTSYGWPHPEFFVGCMDIIVCLALLRFGDEIWELWLCFLFRVSLLIGIMYLINNIFQLGMVSHLAYSVAMEIVMGTALIMVAGVGGWVMAGKTNARAFDPWSRVHRDFIPIHRKTPRDPH